MRTRLSLILVGLCGIALAANAQPIEKVPAKDAWLYAHNGFQMPRTVPTEQFNKVRYGMTLEEMVKLLGKAWMRPNSSIRDIYWGCQDGRVIRVEPKTYGKDEMVIKGTGDELTPGANMQMYRTKSGKVVDIPIPFKGGGKENKNADAGKSPEGKRDVVWQRPWYRAQEPRNLKAELFDEVRSGMTMGELVELLGPIWLGSLGATNYIVWRCEDGRELRADPISGLKDEVLRVDGGRGGIGKMWMMRLKDGRLEGIPIPSLPDRAPKAEVKQSPVLKLKTIHPAHKSQPKVQQFDFEGIGGGSIHRSGPEHFKLTRVDNGKIVTLSVAYDRSELDREGCPRDKIDNRPANSETRYAYNSFFKGVRFHLESGSYEAKDVAVEQDVLNLFGRATLELGVRYRLTWACWPVGAAKATEVSSEFELTIRGKRPEKGGENPKPMLKPPDNPAAIVEGVLLCRDPLLNTPELAAGQKVAPKWIDVSPDYGELKGQQLAGFYALENGRLRICILDRADGQRDVKNRLKEFKTEAGDGVLGLLTLERVQPKNADPKEDKNQPKLTLKEAAGMWEGEKNGIKVSLSVAGANATLFASWEQPAPPTRIGSSLVGLEDATTGRINLRLDLLGEKEGTIRHVILGRLERVNDGSLKLSIIHRDEIPLVEDLMLMRVIKKENSP